MKKRQSIRSNRGSHGSPGGEAAAALLAALLLQGRQSAGAVGPDEDNGQGLLHAVIEAGSLGFDRTGRATQLRHSDDWMALARLWGRISAIEADFDQEWGYSGGDLDWAEANELRATADSLISSLAAASTSDGAALMDSIEASMLLKLINARLDLFSYGSPGLLTRMIPPQIEFDKGSMLQRMELRIDTLASLMRRGTVSTFDATGTLMEMLHSAEGYLLLDAASTSGGILPYGSLEEGSDAGLDPLPLVDASIVRLDSSVAALIAEIERYEGLDEPVPEYLVLSREQAGRTFECLEAVRSAIPAFRTLLLELEIASLRPAER